MAERFVTVLDSDKRPPEMKTWARANDKKTHKLLMKRVTTVPGNNECADCTAKRPGWAALPHGVHICINCAQIHRRIGRHISQVKAINTGTYLWYRDEVDAMLAMGNAKAAQLFLAGGSGKPRAPKKPSATDGVEKKEQYIRDVYEHHKYLNPKFCLAAAVAAPQRAKQVQQQPPTQQQQHQQQTTNAPQLHFQQQQQPMVKKQPAVYDSHTLGPDCASGGDVDFFALFDMKAEEPKAVQQQQQQAAPPADFSDIMSLFRD